MKSVSAFKTAVLAFSLLLTLTSPALLRAQMIIPYSTSPNPFVSGAPSTLSATPGNNANAALYDGIKLLGITPTVSRNGTLTTEHGPAAIMPLSIPPVFEPGETSAADEPGSLILRRPGWTAILTQTAMAITLESSGAYRMKWEGAETSAEIRGIDRQPGVTNYLIGLDKSLWRTGVPQFGKAESRRLYPGVDVVYYPSEDHIEYDLQLAPHANRARIRMGFEGATGIHAWHDRSGFGSSCTHRSANRSP
jgi:hypothetical protein